MFGENKNLGGRQSLPPLTGDKHPRHLGMWLGSTSDSGCGIATWRSRTPQGSGQPGPGTVPGWFPCCASGRSASRLASCLFSWFWPCNTASDSESSSMPSQSLPLLLTSVWFKFCYLPLRTLTDSSVASLQDGSQWFLPIRLTCVASKILRKWQSVISEARS